MLCITIHNNRFAVVNNFKQLARWPAPRSARQRGTRPEVANSCPVQLAARRLSCRDVGFEGVRARRETALLHYDRRSGSAKMLGGEQAAGQRCNSGMVSVARTEHFCGCESLGPKVSS